MSNDKTDYGSDFLYAEDLLSGRQYRTATVEIAEVIPPNTIKAANKKLVDKYVIRFVGKDKQLALCKTNCTVIHMTTGEPPGPAWIGKKITLQVRNVEAFGDEVVAIRVIPPKGTRLRKSLIPRLGTPAVFQGAE